MKTVISFTTQNQGDLDFTAPVSRDQAVQAVKSTIDRHNGNTDEAAIWFHDENTNYSRDWTTFPKPGNFVSIDGGKIKIY